MATLEKQQETIIKLLDESLARAVRVIESRHVASGNMRTRTAIGHDIRRPGSDLLRRIIDRQMLNGAQPSLHEAWLVESLSVARGSIAAISPRSVRATRRARQPTWEIFEGYIGGADKQFTQSTSGVQTCLSKCFGEQDEKYKPEAVEELAHITKLSSTIRHRLRIFKSRTLSALLSGWFLALLLLLVTISIPATYYVRVYWTSNAASLSAAVPLVVESATADAHAIRRAAAKSEAGLIERGATVFELIWKLIDNVSKILAALTAAWAVVRAWMSR